MPVLINTSNNNRNTQWIKNSFNEIVSVVP